jgi:hypothetical protein
MRDPASAAGRAQLGIGLARACPVHATSLALDELAADLMAKANEIEDLQSN